MYEIRQILANIRLLDGANEQRLTVFELGAYALIKFNAIK